MPLITEEEFNLIVKNRDKRIEELTQNNISIFEQEVRLPVFE